MENHVNQSNDPELSNQPNQRPALQVSIPIPPTPTEIPINHHYVPESEYIDPLCPLCELDIPHSTSWCDCTKITDFTGTEGTVCPHHEGSSYFQEIVCYYALVKQPPTGDPNEVARRIGQANVIQINRPVYFTPTQLHDADPIWYQQIPPAPRQHQGATPIGRIVQCQKPSRPTIPHQFAASK